MKFRRDVSAIPLRSAEETWDVVVDIVTGTDTVDLDQLLSARPVLSSLIADEIFAEHPLTWSGVGTRLVVYLCFGADAIQAGFDVDDLTWNPTAGDWRLWVPCDVENLAWARESLNEKAPRIELHEPGAAKDERESAREITSQRGPLRIDWTRGTQ